MALEIEVEADLDKEMLEDDDKGEHRLALGSVGTEEDTDARVGYGGAKQSSAAGKRARSRNDESIREERVHDRTVAQSLDQDELLADLEESR